MKKLHVTIDYADDIESAGGWYCRRHIEQTMSRFQELGISRVYWITYDDSFLTDRLADEDASLTQAVIDAGHTAGLEVYGLFKPFEMGLYTAIPDSISLPGDIRTLSSSSGLHPLVDAFVLDHPEMRIQRRSVENTDRRPGTIKLVKSDAEKANLNADDLEIWTSPVNGNFTHYHGPFEFRNTVELRNGNNCRVLTFAGLQLPQGTQYILVRLSDRQVPIDETGQPSFTNSHENIMEVYDETGEQMSANNDEGPMRMDIPHGQGSLIRKLQMLGLWKDNDPNRHLSIVPKSYGQNPETFGYAFRGDYRKLEGRRSIDRTDGPHDGYAVRTIKENEYLCGALHPCYPEVRQYWLSRIQSCIDAGIDGIDIRICNHSSWVPDGDNYGFNKPAVDEFKKRYGVDVLREGFDLKAWKDLQHEYWVTFLREARSLLKRYDLPLQLHVSSQIGTNIWQDLNNMPGNFNWNWQSWITENDLCDSIHLKWPYIDIAFAARAADFAKQYGKQVTFSLRLQYRKMDGTQNADLLRKFQWALENKNIDAIVFYEKDCFTELDTRKDCVVTLPAMKDLLSRLL